MSAPTSFSSSSRSCRPLLRLAMLVIAAGGLSAVAGFVTIAPGADLAHWPVGGIALAAGWRYGMRWVFPAGLGAAGTGWLTNSVPEAMLTAFASSSLGALAAHVVLVRWSRAHPPASRLHALVRFMMVGLLLAAPVGALTASIGSAGSGFTDGVEIFATHWVMDALGITLVAPALLAVVGASMREPATRPALAFALLATIASLAIAALGAALLDAGRTDLARAVPLLYVLLVAWVAARMPERTHALTLLATALPMLALGIFQSSGQRLPLDGLLLVMFAAVVGLLVQAIAGDRRLALSRLSERLHEDATTGLLTDRGLLLSLEERLGRPGRANQALIGLQVTNFESIQDLCAPDSAVRLEQSIAGLLLRQLPGGRAARLAPGRYACVLTADTEQEIRDLSRALYAQLNGQPFGKSPTNVRLIVNLGGILIDGQARATADECLSSLAEATRVAASVREPRLFVETLSETRMEARRARRRSVENLRDAIREQRLELFAEPMSDPQAPPGMLVFEVLTRLRDSGGRLVLPSRFIPLALEARAITDLDRAVVAQVFGWLSRHPAALARTHRCSINLSGPTISDPATPAYIREQRLRFAIPASRIVFEVTESEAILDPDAARRLLDELRADGFGVALDDFGTGLASFDYLKRFTVDYLKIDGSFIRGLLQTPVDEEIVEATVRIARRLGIRTVAEHVRDQATRDRLTVLGVDIMQGESIGMPRPIGDLFEPVSRLMPRDAAKAVGSMLEAPRPNGPKASR